MNKPIQLPPTFIEQLSIGIIVFDCNDALSYINNSAEELLDISARQAQGIQAEKLFEGSSFNISKGLQRARKQASRITEHRVIINGPTQDKKNISLSFNLIDSTEDFNGSVLIEIVDFNHYLQIDQEEKLLSQNELATNMLRGLAHEIKNPLGGLRGAAQLLAKELDGSYSDYTHVIIEEADRLRKLVDRMLGSSERPNHQPINIHVIMERVRQLAVAEVGEGIRLISDYDPSIPDITADKDQLIQAILNVVRNAIQAVGAQGIIILKTRIHRNFTISEETYRLAVKIDVIDDGPGISEDMLTKIFYPMVTGRPDGTGLGLAIAQKNVQRHNGIIEVTSEPGRTVFSTILPLEKKDE